MVPLSIDEVGKGGHLYIIRIKVLSREKGSAFHVTASPFYVKLTNLWPILQS